MTLELGIVLGVTLMALVLFVTELLRVDVVAMLVLIILLLTGILTPAEGLAGFSNEATITIAAMFVLSEGLRRTGGLSRLTRLLGRIFEQNHILAIFLLMLGAATVSAFINNVAVVAIMLPVMLGLCRDMGMSPTRILIPLSFAAMFGGTCTLIGTSANLVVSGLLIDHDMEPIGMFEMTPVGLLFVVAGIAYLLTLGRRLLPARGDGHSFGDTYERGEFRADLRVLPGHRSLGKVASEFFQPGETAKILGVHRDSTLLSGDLDNLELQSNDVLRLSASVRTIQRLRTDDKLMMLPLEETSDATDVDGLNLFEVVVSPESPMVGKTLSDAGFERHHPAVVIALRRAGKVVVENLLDVPIQGGDVLLMQAPRKELRRLQKNDDFIVISELGLPDFKEKLLIPVIFMLGAVVAFSALGWAPIVILALAAAVVLILMRVLRPDHAYEAIDWEVIFLLGGFIPLGVALEKTGAIDLISEAIVGWFGQFGPLAMLAGIYFVTNFMSDVISNNATAVLLVPVAIGTAAAMGVDPRPFVIAVAFASSASFASPVGYHTNVMIYTAGDYRYTDFIKVGVPLNLFFLVVAVIFIPMIWGF